MSTASNRGCTPWLQDADVTLYHGDVLAVTQAALREAVLGFIGYAFPDDDPDEIFEDVLSGFMQSGQLRCITSKPKGGDALYGDVSS